MIRFASPGALLALALVPVLILLHMLRARRTDTRVSSIFLWRETARELAASLPVRRVERTLLLALQIIAVVLGSLALARPQLLLPGLAGDRLVIVLDTSASMQATDVPPSRFAVAQAQATEAAARLGAGQEGMVIEASRAPRIAQGFTRDPELLRRAVASLEPTDAPGNLAAAVALARAQREPGRRLRVAVFTDGAEPFGAAPEVTVRVVAGSGENVGVVSLGTAEGPSGTRIVARVRSFAASTRTVPVRITLNGREIARHTLTLAPGGALGVSAALRPGEAGIVIARVLGRDALAADDAAYAVVGQPPLPRVRLVTPGSPFLEHALAAMPIEGLQTTTDPSPARYPVGGIVVLDRVAPVSLPPGRYLLIATVAANLPAEVEGHFAAPAIVGWDRTDPLMRFVDLSDVRVAEALALRPRGGRVVVDGDVPLVWAYEGRGIRAVVVTFPLERSTLPLRVAFPLFIRNALEWLGGGLADLGTGSEVTLAAGSAVEATLVRPDGTPAVVRAADGVFDLPRLDRAGVYLLRVGDEDRLFAANLLSQREGQLRPVVAAGRGGATGTAERLPRETRTWWLALALAAVAAEFAWFVRSRAPARRPA